MSDWLFDLGNSRFKFAPLQQDRAGTITAWEHELWLEKAIETDSLPTGNTAYIASVAAPELSNALLNLLQPRFKNIQLVYSQAECAGVQIAYSQPLTLGVDRFLSLLAAHSHKQDCLITSVGTALTIDLLSASGRHYGGKIAPSPTIMRQALHLRASQLPAEGGQYQEFADNTTDALVAGCNGAAIALIEHSLQQALIHISLPPKLLIHGGGASELLPLLPSATYCPSLVLDGLAIWAIQNPSLPL